MRQLFLLLPPLAALVMSSVAQATPVTVTNFSFETPTVAGDSTYVLAPGASGAFNGWGFNKTTGSGFQDFGIENPGSQEYTGAAGTGTPSGADGTNVAFLNQSIVGGITNIFQDVGSLQANTQYTLTIAVGQRLDRTNGSVTIALFNTAAGSGLSGNPFTDVTSTLLNSTAGVSSVAGSFQDFSVAFTTGASVTGDLTIGAQYTGDGTAQGSLDDVRLDATLVAIPEPGAIAMLLAGFGMFFGFRRSRR